ncbi:MAG TPA: MFS transporter [Stellaceae bacterium]|jgi:putative MFS transporter|nr:MFS transporter [Stellaceae bacterium]
MVDIPLASAIADSEAVVSARAQRDIAARMERLPITRTQVKARIIVGMATFFDGYDSLVMGLVMPVLAAAWHLTTAEIGYLLSGTFFGQLLGAMLFPYLAERYGRLRAASYSVWVVGLFALVCAASWNFSTLIISRVLQGIGIGGEIPVAATYINEIAQSKTRGRFFLMYEAAFAVGYLICTLLAVLLVVRYGWQLMFIIGALPAFVAAIMRRVLPESPRWLASKGRIKEADAIVGQMEREAEGKLGGSLPAPDYSVAPPPVGQRTDLRELFTPFYRMRTLVVWSIWGLSFFVTQALNTWLPTIYRQELHLSVQQALEFTLATHCISICSALVVALAIDHTGRRYWIGSALLVGSLSLLVLAFEGGSNPIFLLVCATIANFSLASVSVSIYVFTSELYPTRMRALGCGMGSTVRNVFTTLSPSLVAVMLSSYGLPGVFGMLGLAPLLPCLMVFAWGTETKGRVLEEVSP